MSVYGLISLCRPELMAWRFAIMDYGVESLRISIGGIMGRVISAVITTLVFCGACLSQQGQKSSQQPPPIATPPAPELQSPANAFERSAVFDVGEFPIGVAFDGTNIWVANAESNNVKKLRASNGAVLGTFKVGKFPIGITFDGTNIWVANGETNNVMKLRGSDGALLGTFKAGTKPAMVAFDGANVWVVNSDSNTVSKLRASDGAVLGSFSVGRVPLSVAFDGANIWVD
jgi:hypothetical protein